MAKAYVDTTVLTDVALKSGAPRDTARAALARYETSQLPVYAIKEFKAGPLKNFVWMHNKFAITQDFAHAMAALHAMSRTPRRYTTSTAIEAQIAAFASFAKETPASLTQKYGPDADLRKVLCDEYRLALKRIVFEAWSKRRSYTTEVVGSLSCYEETGPYQTRGVVVLEPMRCELEGTCALAPAMKARPDDLRAMKDAIDKNGATGREHQRRTKVLRQLYRTPKMPVTDENCRDLGDAIIVFFAPNDSEILTTNVKDHRVLADSLGKQVKSP